jgi:hypothetical protein
VEFASQGGSRFHASNIKNHFSAYERKPCKNPTPARFADPPSWWCTNRSTAAIAPVLARKPPASMKPSTNGTSAARSFVTPLHFMTATVSSLAGTPIRWWAGSERRRAPNGSQSASGGKSHSDLLFVIDNSFVLMSLNDSYIFLTSRTYYKEHHSYRGAGPGFVVDPRVQYSNCMKKGIAFSTKWCILCKIEHIF